MDGTSVQELKAFCTQTLRQADMTESADLEARLLVEKVTALDQIQQILHSDRLLEEDQICLVKALLEERLKGRPMAYILGYKDFYGRSFLVDERVLIPRPDTETLVEVALHHAKSKNRRLSIIDVCTGSGCVGITLACELGYDVTLSDISPDALAVAKSNAMALVGHPLEQLQGDLLSPLTDKYDIIVSNPPYLTAQWCEEVSIDVKHEPRLALDGLGDDGLELIRTLVEESTHCLNDHGSLMLECDYRQVDEVKKIMASHGFASVKSEKDLTERERVVWGIYNCTNN